MRSLLRWFATFCYAFQRTRWRRVWLFRRGSCLPAAIAKHLTDSPLWVELQPGVKMLLDPRDLISRVLLETGEWDPDTWNAMAEHLPLGGTFVDVGAHMGHCSLLAATTVGPEGRVVAVEANPEMAQLLSRNIQASGARVSVQPIACSDEETTIDLFVSSHANSGSSSISRDNASLAGAPEKCYRVPSIPLDAVLRGLNVAHVDVLKIDVEGAELRVLQGAAETLTRDHPVLMIELDDKLLGAMGTSAAEIRKVLTSYGYKSDGAFDDANIRFVPSHVDSYEGTERKVN